MKQFTLSQIASFLEAKMQGNPDHIITGVASLDKADANQITFFGKVDGFSSDRMKFFLKDTNAGALILEEGDIENCKKAKNFLIVDNPYLSYAKLTKLFFKRSENKLGIHEKATIGLNCQIPNSASVGANCVLGNNVSLGENVVIQGGCVLGDKVVVGNDTYLYPNVTIYQGVKMGSGVVVHSGAVIGSDGFGMANDKGVWVKIYHSGSVYIGDDVEIGANTCIDRGTFNDTVIENGVKLDNLIQIGHNVKIGSHTVVAGCSAIAGSTVIGKFCMIGGRVS